MTTREDPIFRLRDAYLRSAKAPMPENLVVVNQEFIQLIRHAAANSAYWREILPDDLFSGHELAIYENLSLFPIQTRIDIQNTFSKAKIYIPNSQDSDYTISTTSGTTGNPVQVLKYLPTYRAEYEAANLVEWRWFRRDIGKTLIRLRPNIEQDRKYEWGDLAYGLGAPGDSYELLSNGRNLDDVVEKLLSLKPAYLVAAPGQLVLLAKELMRINRKLESLEQLLTVGETVEDWHLKLFHDVYGAAVVDRYSSEEFGFIAIQCPRANHLHTVMPSVFVEILNEEDNPCQIGEPGRLVITGLHSFAMPLIRYEIGDLAVWGESTNCGITWPIIDKIIGRTRDLRPLPDGNVFLRNFSGADFRQFPEIRDFQVILLDDAIVVVVALADDLKPSQIEAIELGIADILRLDLPVKILVSERFPILSSLKRQNLVRLSMEFNEELSAIHILELLEAGQGEF